MTQLPLNNADDSWVELSLCRQTDPEAFYPEGSGSSPAAAKAICRRCDVRENCLEYALANDEKHGVWGGRTAHERKLIKTTGVRQPTCEKCGNQHDGPLRSKYCDDCKSAARADTRRRSDAKRDVRRQQHERHAA